jgi:hypothetical protein
MRIKLDDLKKLELTGTTASSAGDFEPGDILTAILKVKKSNYVPKKVKLRARIDEQMFTGEFAAGDLQKIESDKNVVSIALSRPLRRIA